MKTIQTNTVDFIDNYDATEREPIVFPAKIPNLLVNGSDGIAVGVATNIPPHNVNDVIDTTVHYIDKLHEKDGLIIYWNLVAE